MKDHKSNTSSNNRAINIPSHPHLATNYERLLALPEQLLLGRLRRTVVGPAVGQVLEIGAGTGANLCYYNNSVEQVTLTEPDPYMLWQAAEKARGLNHRLQLVQCPAEKLPFADHAFDTVVVTLVLCTVMDQAATFAELQRVLKPGGTVRFLEHVRSTSAWAAQLQDRLTPLWRRCAAGCHLNRSTAEMMQAAGFNIVQLQRKSLPLLPLIFGVAQR